MKFHRFIARNAADAIAQIRAELGPEAIVAHVSPLPHEGVANLWKKPRLEVLAYVPETEVSAPQEEIAPPAPLEPSTAKSDWSSEIQPSPNETRGVGLLRHMGLLPLQAEQVWEAAERNSGGQMPTAVTDEIHLLRKTLSGYWKVCPTPRETVPIKPEVFIGPPGCGKTTVLCKWLAQCVLKESKQVAAYRLDGPGTNLSSYLTLLCEMLGVPVHRVWKPQAANASAVLNFIDLPGINFRDTEALAALQRRLKEFPGARIHLCLNAAYTSPLLVEQVRAFSRVQVDDLIFTHLDEEKCWGKLWNFVVGTSYPVLCLAAGQNIPGDLRSASPELLFRS